MNVRNGIAAAVLAGALVGGTGGPRSAAEELQMELRYQQETSPGSGRYHRLTRDETWKAEETAVIVCDVWDLHHCWNAVRRVQEFAPRLNQVVAEARRRGAMIIHAPSDCMEAYADHPARRRAQQAPAAASLPEDIGSWCSKIPSEERGQYPIDQSDGGEDDDPKEHAEWEARLKAMGRNPDLPWKKQYDVIRIDDQRDFISDRGEEVWNILEQRGIKNVILTGVHTNMCVLGRPFGLRQMARNGKNVVLMRDMTDTMYNPQRWPYVSHFTGTDLIVAHIEKFVCPTVTSDQLVGGHPFRFAADKRPHLVIVMAEDEYKTNETLPKFAADQLGKKFRVSYVHGSETERHRIPGMEVLDEADLALLSIRRRWLPDDAMQSVRRFVESGKPVLGIRTASHAFEVRNQEPPEGFQDWPEFDAVVFGGNYHGHHANQLRSEVTVVEQHADHPILQRFTPEPFEQGGSLYQTSPLKPKTVALLRGKAEGKPDEPVAWTFQRGDKGKSFYTSLGHVDDFANPQFVGFLRAAIAWAAGLPGEDAGVREAKEDSSDKSAGLPSDEADHWSLVRLPRSDSSPLPELSRDSAEPLWLRSAVRLPTEWLNGDLTLELVGGEGRWRLWCNGQAAQSTSPRETSKQSSTCWMIPRDALRPSEANLIVLRREGPVGALEAPLLRHGSQSFPLNGFWQCRAGDDPAWSNMPLPAKFGAAPDIVFQP